MPIAGIQRVSFLLWIGGVPLLALGVLLLKPLAAQAGGGMLAIPAVLGTFDAVAIVAHAFRQRRG
jgi:hypothetical protein